MKFLVLMCVALLPLAFTESDTQETFNLINSTNLAKPGCERRCGDLIVPYPFGIIFSNDTNNCSINTGFDIYCNTSLDPPKASFTGRHHASIKLISDSTIRHSNLVASSCSFSDGSSRSRGIYADYKFSPYTYSEVNKFIVLGCNGYTWLKVATKNRTMYTGCMVFCSALEEVVDGECLGNGCCQSSIPNSINYIATHKLGTLSRNVRRTSASESCAYAFVGEANAFKFNGTADIMAIDANDTSFMDGIESSVPVVLDWAIGNQSCAKVNGTKDFVCQANSSCVDSKREAGGYRCECKEGYEGNPYLYPGCHAY